jgi:hypothetical protein
MTACLAGGLRPAILPERLRPALVESPGAFVDPAPGVVKLPVVADIKLL